MKHYWAIKQVFPLEDIEIPLVEAGMIPDSRGACGYMAVFDDKARALAIVGGREELLLDLVLRDPPQGRPALVRKGRCRAGLN